MTINKLLSGTFDTVCLAKHPAHRFGQPDELGHTCAYLCSVHAGYINGQNLLMDGGSFPGVF